MNILAVSLAYPPLAYPRSIQVARLLKHTDASTVLFCADEPKSRIDETIEPEAEARLKACIRVPVAKSRFSGLIDKLSFRFAPGVWNRRNLMPDGYGSWKNAVVNRVIEHIDNTGFRPYVIVTFAQPFTDHLIGIELRSRLNLPWLAHFSDPWVDNPFMPFDKATRELNKKLEQSVAEKADLLVFTSVETVELFYAKYQGDLKKKARVLPQCYEPESYTDSHDSQSGPIRIRYLGNFYGDRTPKPLISGLLRLYESIPSCLENVVFELIGSGDDEMRSFAGSLPGGLVNFRSSVSYRESLDLMTAADGLLIIDAPAEISVFLPSKLIDYVGTGRPILGITPDGTAASLIRELGGAVCGPDNAVDVAEKLVRFIEDLRARRRIAASPSWGEPSVRDRFKAERVAANFRTMLDSIRGGTFRSF